jgi:hypothetical protein
MPCPPASRIARSLGAIAIQPGHDYAERSRPKCAANQWKSGSAAGRTPQIVGSWSWRRRGPSTCSTCMCHSPATYAVRKERGTIFGLTTVLRA